MADGSFKLVDMDDKSYKNALKLAKSAKLNPFTKKTSTGMELSVFGSNRDIMKFLKSLPEQYTGENKMSSWKEIIENKIEQLVMSRLQNEEDSEYQEFFQKCLKKFGVESPAELEGDEKKKEFFDYVDKNWKGDNEKAEETTEKSVEEEPEKKKKLAASNCGS
jgi:hypothetical protein